MKYIDEMVCFDSPVKIGDDCIVLKNVHIGKYTYLGRNCVVDKGTIIGKYCSIGINCYFNPGSHPLNWLSSHPFQYTDAHFGRNDEIYRSIERKKIGAMKNCEIGNDVYIGSGVTIFKGVSVGHGAVIGANSTVTKDIPPYAIAVGSPAKVIRYRFEGHIIELLLKIKWWDLPLEVIRSIEFDNIEVAIDQLCMIKGIDGIIKTKKRGCIQYFLKFFHRA